jgi:HSP20 family protein
MAIHDLIPWRNRDSFPVWRRGGSGNDPLRELRQRVNGLIDDFFGPWSEFRQGWWTDRDAFIPRIDVRESDKEYRVTAELPGIDEKDVDVSISGNSLVIKGEKKEEHEREEDGYYGSERSFGSFERVINVPDVDPDSGKAEFKKGVLRITLKKKPEAQSKRKRITLSAN